MLKANVFYCLVLICFSSCIAPGVWDTLHSVVIPEPDGVYLWPKFHERIPLRLAYKVQYCTLGGEVFVNYDAECTFHPLSMTVLQTCYKICTKDIRCIHNGRAYFLFDREEHLSCEYQPDCNATCTDTSVSLGCFKDKVNSRDLPKWIGSVNSPKQCLSECQKRTYTYAGLQNGGECRCGFRYGKHGMSDNCNRKCKDGLICGGRRANTIFEVDDTMQQKH